MFGVSVLVTDHLIHTPPLYLPNHSACQSPAIVNVGSHVLRYDSCRSPRLTSSSSVPASDIVVNKLQMTYVDQRSTVRTHVTY